MLLNKTWGYYNKFDYEIYWGKSLICQNTITRLCGMDPYSIAFHVQKLTAHRAVCYNFPLVRDKPQGTPTFVRLVYSCANFVYALAISCSNFHSKKYSDHNLTHWVLNLTSKQTLSLQDPIKESKDHANSQETVMKLSPRSAFWRAFRQQCYPNACQNSLR